jgi:glyoxylase-like metal-dependent hydrolase (beta-lactamase superfamily II)
MAIACELVQVAPSLVIWQCYEPALKADLFSTAITTRNGRFLVDPIPLTDAALGQLLNADSVDGVIVTNRNHLRASAEFADRFSVPIFAHAETFPPGQGFPGTKVGDGGKICDELAVIGVAGAAAGEIVLHSTTNGGTLITGDALINFEPYGFTFLPRKYCSNEKEMRRSLRKLLTCKAERMLFAHGPPILSRAGERLQQLLDANL